MHSSRRKRPLVQLLPATRASNSPVMLQKKDGVIAIIVIADNNVCDVDGGCLRSALYISILSKFIGDTELH